jgi:hypothetical protein
VALHLSFLACWENVVTFGLPDPDEALREAEEREVDAERKALADAQAAGDENPEPDANEDDDGEKA